MRFSPKARLAAAAALFLAWIGWLGYLAFTAGTIPVTQKGPVILSHPQSLTSQLYVIAELKPGPAPLLYAGALAASPQAGWPAAIPWTGLQTDRLQVPEGPSQLAVVREVVWPTQAVKLAGS